ncbi:Hypothetical_protein [Hexamita inflata]|uniref:Hypothetical_protein n=1 Tax=Hexamita inflata TaxID=28002 RepID=A0AA86V770_9EUKA|nr:Hypothetical protein HINF_LOCUS66617 [Hexamita inflata]
MPIKTLSDTMSEIKEKVAIKLANSSMLTSQSLLASNIATKTIGDSDNFLDKLEKSLRVSSVQSQHVKNDYAEVEMNTDELDLNEVEEEMTKEKLDEIEVNQQITQQSIEQLLTHTSKYLVKLSNAIIFLKRDVEELKQARDDKRCECEVNGTCGCNDHCECNDCEQECGDCQCGCNEQCEREQCCCGDCDCGEGDCQDDEDCCDCCNCCCNEEEEEQEQDC